MTEVKESPTYQDFCDKVAQTIGGEITSDRVANFLKHASEKGLLFRGIKSRKRSEQAIKEGVLPSAPDGGKMASWWAFDQYIFAYPSSMTQGMFGYDSPFFNYSHWSDSEASGFSLAITLKESASKHGIIEHIGQAEITEPLDPQLIQFIQIVKPLTNPSELSRSTGQTLEQKAFEFMEKIAAEGPQFGSVIRATI